MKDKLSGAMKKFSGAIVQPIMFMAVTGIILSAGVILRMDNMPALLKHIFLAWYIRNIYVYQPTFT